MEWYIRLAWMCDRENERVTCEWQKTTTNGHTLKNVYFMDFCCYLSRLRAHDNMHEFLLLFVLFYCCCFSCFFFVCLNSIRSFDAVQATVVYVLCVFFLHSNDIAPYVNNVIRIMCFLIPEFGTIHVISFLLKFM